MRKQASSPHGPVRRITDPEVLRKLGEEYASKAVQVRERNIIPCNGSTVRLLIDGNYEVISDRDISRLLETDAARSDSLKLKRKKRMALAGFRRMLSEKGSSAFSKTQTDYLASLVFTVRNPASYAISDEERKRRNTQIRALFDYHKAQKKGHGMEQAVCDFFSVEKVVLVTARVSEILKPYGLENEAAGFVIECGGLIMGFAYELSKPPEMCGFPMTYKERLRTLFLSVLDPNSSEYYAKENENAVGCDIMGKDLDSLPGLLRHALRDVRYESAQLAHDAMTSISRPPIVREISAGSPGSAKGGGPGH